MPPRMVCLAILTIWLGLNGWLFYQELLPRLMPGQVPPFTIDLVEETQTRRPHIEWVVEHEGKRAFRAKTYVTHPEHDVFELTAEFSTPFGEPAPMHGIRVKRMKSSYTVNSVGDLLGLDVEIDGIPQLAAALRLVKQEFSVAIRGQVNNREITPQLTLEMPGRKFERKLPTVKVPAGGSVLLPLHPVNRMQGIRLGDSWTMRVFDPIAGSLSVFGGDAGELQLLRARVRPEFESFSYGRRQKVDCLVIDYEGENLQASTWVAKERGLVLCQEAIIDNQRWAMYRD